MPRIFVSIGSLIIANSRSRVLLPFMFVIKILNELQNDKM